jgi:hypothetical protein
MRANKSWPPPIPLTARGKRHEQAALRSGGIPAPAARQLP